MSGSRRGPGGGAGPASHGDGGSRGEPGDGTVAGPGTVPGVGAVPRGALISAYLRSFTIQGSWNYRTMIGSGFAFAMLPVLRALAPSRGESLEAALRRHAEHFNAHPYLTSMALGATARLEQEGEEADVVRRFKAAIRGPLGGLGDALVWAAWLPSTVLAALVAAWAGLAPWACVLLFLVLYNTGHLTLRTWGFGAGFEAGRYLGPILKSANLAPLAERVSRVGAVLVGVLAGLILAADPGFRDPAWLWIPLALAALAVGATGGHRVWRPAALVVVAIVVGVTLVQALP